MLEVRNLGWAPRLNGVSLERARRAKSSGSAGSTARASANCCWRCSACCAAPAATILVDGKPVAHQLAARRPSRDRIGMALIPEDRKTEGLMLPMSVRDNLSFAALSMFCARRHHRSRRRAPRHRRNDQAARASRPTASAVPAGSLSGGNQQKVVHRQMADAEAAHHPAQRSDARHRCRHQAGNLPLLRQLADAGAAIMLYSTDYDELIGCCDQVLVMYDGAVRRDAGRRRDHRAGADRQRAQHRRGARGRRRCVPADA